MRIGTIGSGGIVMQFIESARLVEGVEFEAVYSRDLERGNQFAQACKINKVYTSLDELFADEAIDCIYIASPNSLHYPQAKQALLSGKNVIVEKPFAGNEMRAQELIRIAKEKKLFLFEAICNIHMPNFNYVKENLKQLGTIRLVQCNYSQYSSKYDALVSGELPNVFNPKFSGGALADINIYNIHFILALFGAPRDVEYLANRHENGIDTSGILTLTYDDFIVEAVGAKDSFSKNFGQIQGEKGFMYIPNGVNGMDSVELHTKTDKIEYNSQDKPRLFYQVDAFKKMVDTQDLKQCHEWLEHSLNVVRVAEKARRRINLFFDY